jgi:hypothetical protein
MAIQSIFIADSLKCTIVARFPLTNQPLAYFVTPLLPFNIFPAGDWALFPYFYAL